MPESHKKTDESRLAQGRLCLRPCVVSLISEFLVGMMELRRLLALSRGCGQARLAQEIFGIRGGLQAEWNKDVARQLIGLSWIHVHV